MVNTPPSPDPSDILVVIPTLNEAAYIAGTLSQIIEHDPVAAVCPVIVADGGSTDSTQNIVRDLSARFPNLRLVHNPGRTQAAALNMMLEDAYAGAKCLIRCDAHAKYPPNFVTDLVSALDDADAASVVIPMDAIAENHCFQRGLAWISDSKLGAGGSPHRGGVASGYVDHGHHAAFRMSVFRDLGGYDTSFIANEDAEYDQRVIKSGGQIWLESKIRIGYYPRKSARSLWKQYAKYGQGRAQTCLKHRIKPKLRQLIPVVHVVLLCLSLVLVPFTTLGLIWPLLYCLIVLAAGAAMALRHRSACGLFGSVGLAVMHTAWGLGFLAELIRNVLGTKAQ